MPFLVFVDSTAFVVLFLLVNWCSASCKDDPYNCEPPDCMDRLSDNSPVQAQNCLKIAQPVIDQMSDKDEEISKNSDGLTPDDLAVFNLEMYDILCSDQGKRGIQCMLDIVSSTCPEAFTYARNLPYSRTTPLWDTFYFLHFGSVDAICSGIKYSKCYNI
ncbi:uncharacterized protein LOC123534470 [Mercenaria mercenaria]|uniref:uncharacterized protein LOC123534470 n=1 Tax=Mercenaria mercenaria TaxID=6596 RepID=UPI00234F66EC|nr:uncharacterized protein LOC123534470 [Mercenaria mercenaria]